MNPPLQLEPLSSPVSLRDAVQFSPTPQTRKFQTIVLYVVSGFVGMFWLFGLLFLFVIGLESLIFVALFVLPPTLFAIGLVSSTLKGARRAIRVKRFAEANHFAFTANRPVDSDPGLVFSIGDSKNYTTITSGTYNGLPFEFGNFYSVEGSGKNAKHRAFGVISVKLVRRLPHILLDSTANNSFGFSNLPRFYGSQHLTLEGNFNDYFNLYVPDGYERDALYVITPELMALLVDHGADFDIEIVDDRLYIYKSTDFRLEDPKTMRQIFQLISVLGAEVLENTGRYSDANVGDRQANVVAEPGRRLKRFPRWAIAIFWVLWGVFVALFISQFV